MKKMKASNLEAEVRRLREVEQAAIQFVKHSYMPGNEGDRRRFLALARALHMNPREWDLYVSQEIKQ